MMSMGQLGQGADQWKDHPWLRDTDEKQREAPAAGIKTSSVLPAKADGKITSENQMLPNKGPFIHLERTESTELELLGKMENKKQR